MAKQKSARLSKQMSPDPYIYIEQPIYGFDGDRVLYEAIENERGTIAKAESLLRCLKISLESDADDVVTAPYYPDIAEIACSLLRQAVNGLDSLALSNAVMKPKSRNMKLKRKRD